MAVPIETILKPLELLGLRFCWLVRLLGLRRLQSLHGTENCAGDHSMMMMIIMMMMMAVVVI
jgi:hypothetical protein